MDDEDPWDWGMFLTPGLTAWRRPVVNRFAGFVVDTEINDPRFSVSWSGVEQWTPEAIKARRAKVQARIKRR